MKKIITWFGGGSDRKSNGLSSVRFALLRYSQESDQSSSIPEVTKILLQLKRKKQIFTQKKQEKAAFCGIYFAYSAVGYQYFLLTMTKNRQKS